VGRAVSNLIVPHAKPVTTACAGASPTATFSRVSTPVELERAEEAKIVAALGTRTTSPDDLTSMLTLLVRKVLAAERRLGAVIFRDMLGLHFSSTRPVEDALAEHPLAEFVIAAIAEAQGAGRVPRNADAGELGVIFMTGLFALLATAGPASRARTALLDRYVMTIVGGMEAR